MALKTLDERVRDLEDENVELKAWIRALEKMLRAVPLPGTDITPDTIEKRRGNPNWVKKS